jgi:Right handed beta helix region
MDPARKFAYCCLALIALAAFGGQAFATNTVAGLCAGSGTHYTTIQAAVNAASSGGKVSVCPGTYPEQVSITKSLTLVGIVNTSASTDAAVVVVPAGGLVQTGSDIYGNPVAAQILVTGATSVTVSHLTVDGSNNGLSGCGTSDPIGIYYQNSTGTITYNAVRDVLMDPAYQGCGLGLAINVESNTGAPAVTISDNSVRNYDKNGITASGPGTGTGGPAVKVSNNTVIGIGATSVIAQNGIQIGFGATGSVTSNDVADDIYVNPANCGQSGQPECFGSSGILIYASSGVTVTSNTVESTQLAIVPNTDPTYGPADDTVITSNHIGGTQTYDAIDLCSSGNTAETNVIYGSAQSGVHVDDSCGSGNNNTVTKNTINEACAGVLLGTGSNNTVSPNTFANVTNTTQAGDSCSPLAEVKTGQKHSSFRSSPRKPSRE